MPLTNKTVMVVEDTYDDMELVSTILKHSGIKVQVAKNGVECLALIKDIPPALIVSDLSMPEMDGWEMLKQLRENPDTANIPIVAVTAYYSIDVAQDAIDAGFDGYFAKPVSPMHFVERLEAIVTKSH